MLPLQVKAPVIVPVAARSDGAEFEDRFRLFETPSGAGDAEAVLDEISARTLDDACRDRQAVGEESSVVDARGVLAQVLDGLVERPAFGEREASVGRRLANGRHDVERMASEQLAQDVPDPGIGRSMFARAEHHRDGPEVVNHVDQVEHDGDAHPSSKRLGFGVLDLLLVAIEEHEGASLAVWVSTLGLVEQLGHAFGVTLGDARGDTLVLGPGRLVRARPAPAALGVAPEPREDILGGAYMGLLLP